MFRYIKLGKTKARVFGNLICLVLMMFEFDISSLMIWFANFRFMLYSKCSNWCQISKLLLNFRCLFTLCYFDGANSIETDLHICNLWIGQFVSYKSVIQFLVNFPKQNIKK